MLLIVVTTQCLYQASAATLDAEDSSSLIAFSFEHVDLVEQLVANLSTQKTLKTLSLHHGFSRTVTIAQNVLSFARVEG